MALFFDLSIPYLEDGGGSPSENKARKDARLKAVVRAMELGYVAVAYDRPFRGVLSDALRCNISPFSLDSLLKAAPVLASSAAFHRDLLGAPRSSTFRQYTRLTILVAGAAAVVSLNGNALLRTYDLVAVRPLDQEAFDKACESSMVDIIALDFSQKLPFRLKIPSIKLAIQRGLYFEITYSHLIADSHVRRKILSDVKLLSDWSRGKNLLISSAASTVNDVRGPLDVANLAVFLLGLSAEHAKYTISQNCRSLLANAIRKKQFYKETIRLERVIPDGQFNPKSFSLDKWNKWDPISSDKGDLLSLDDITKFPTFIRKQSFGSNSIDFPLSTEPSFLLGDKTKKLSSPMNPASPVTPCEPCAIADDVTQDDDSLRNHMATPEFCAVAADVIQDNGSLKNHMATPELCAGADGVTEDNGSLKNHMATPEPCVVANDVTQDNSSTNHMAISLASLGIDNAACEEVLISPDAIGCMRTLLADVKDCQPVMKDISTIFVLELKENDLIDTSPTCRSPGRPLLCNQVDGSISFVDNFLQKGSFNETKEHDDLLYVTIDDPEVKSNIMAKEETQKSKDKSGNRKRKQRSFYPTYHLPFKGLFKPMFVRNNGYNPKRTRNIYFIAVINKLSCGGDCYYSHMGQLLHQLVTRTTCKSPRMSVIRNLPFYCFLQI
ncbi:uncharacterized protein LOC122038595 [Zingiber officinale]|uniref:uncharacterized protein LOC122038595 n=1 Tax=Zingiber officinale TaxID=94328 RepID=UPI001C4B6308|nr:uncharacterized protein LOC122038595 [Zingiber officinale]